MDILKSLKIIKDFYRTAGVDCVRFGVVRNSKLYFNNKVCQIELPIDIPFPCEPELNQLYRFYALCDNEKSIVFNDGAIDISDNNVKYKVECNSSVVENILQYPSTQMFDVSPEFVEVFIDVLSLGKEVILPEAGLLDPAFNCINFYNNKVYFSDSHIIIEYTTGFNFPNFMISLKKVDMLLKLMKKVKLKQLGISNNTLVCKFEHDVLMYVDSEFIPSKADKLLNTLEKYYNHTKGVVREFDDKFLENVNYLAKLNPRIKNLQISDCHMSCATTGLNYKTTGGNFAFAMPITHAKFLHGCKWLLSSDGDFVAFYRDKYRGVVSTVKNRKADDKRY